MTAWTTNPKQRVEQELFWDNNSSGVLNIKARYVGDPGSQVSMMYDFRKQCGRARIASESPEKVSSFSVTVLGNPTTNDRVTLEVRGVAGQTMQMGLANSQGQIMSQQTFQATGNVEQRSMKVGRQPGMYFIKVATPTESQTIKVLRN